MQYSRILSLLVLLVLLGLAATPCRALAGEIYVVTHASVNLSADDVREVFLGEKQFAGSAKLTPIENASLQAEFLAKVMKVDAAKYALVWSKKGFREGLTPPPVKGSDADIINGVKANPGTVGYVSKPTADVKVVLKL